MSTEEALVAMHKFNPLGLGVQGGDEPEVEIRPLFDPTDFYVPREAVAPTKLGKV
jgi:hypothetical protein